MTPGNRRSDRVAVWCLRRLVPGHWRDSVEGDLIEAREARQAAGRRAGPMWVVGSAVWAGVRLRLEARRRVLSPSREFSMDRLRLDLRHTWRALRANPGYTLAAVLTLTIGIGANASVFNLAHWLLMRPIPGVQQPASLVSVTLGSADFTVPMSHPDFLALREGVTALESVAATFDMEINEATPSGQARRVNAALVSGGYFDVLGQPVGLGRGFSDREGTDPSASPVAVISHAHWTSLFGGAADALGQSISLNGHPFTIIGVTRPGFHGTSRSGTTDVWVPVAQHLLALPVYGRDLLTNPRRTVYFALIGRLNSGATLEQVEAQANAIRDARAAAGLSVTMAGATYRVQPGMDPNGYRIERLTTTFMILLGAVGLLLVLTCANAGNLMLARAASRRGEIATRSALGASRASLVRLLIIESLGLAGVAAALSLGLSWGLARLFEGVAVLPGAGPLGRVTMNWQVFGFALALAAVVALAASLVPALAVSRRAGTAGRDGLRVASGHGSRRVLIGMQMAVSVTLLLGSVLLMRSMYARLSIDPGFDPARVLNVSLEPGLQGYTPQRTEAFYRDLVARTRQVPGVRGAGLAWLQPFGFGASDTALRAAGAAPETNVPALHNMVSPGFLAAMDIRLLDGRDFSDTEFLRRETEGEGVVIITESLATKLFGTPGAAGRKVAFRYPEGRERTVVGVIVDQRPQRVTAETGDLVLEPFGQSFVPGFVSLQIGVDGRPAGIIDAVSRIVQDFDASLPIYQVQTLDAAVRRTMADELLLARSVTAFAVLAMLVAALGLAAVLARSVTERQREFGIRVALGATPARLASLVSREALAMTLAGAMAGLVMAWWLGRYISSRLYDVTATDPLSYAGAAAGVVLLALAVSVLPARRAARVDPARSLR